MSTSQSGPADVMDSATVGTMFPHLCETLPYLISGVKVQKRHYVKVIRTTKSSFNWSRAIVPFLSFVSASSIALSQSTAVGPGNTGTFAIIGIVSSSAVAALATWLASMRFDAKYSASLDTYYALTRLQDEIEFRLRSELESKDSENTDPPPVDSTTIGEWRKRLDDILTEAGLRYGKLVQAAAPAARGDGRPTDGEP